MDHPAGTVGRALWPLDHEARGKTAVAVVAAGLGATHMKTRQCLVDIHIEVADAGVP
jgi:hypothetical protein